MKSQAHIRIAAFLLLAVTVSACGAGSLETMFVNPGSFDYLSCSDISNTAVATSKREQELKGLIDRAEQESAGVLVAAAAYRTELLKARGDLNMLAEAARTKKCEVLPKS
jgi:hypothetical protein